MSKRILVNYFTEDMFKQNTRKLIYSKVFNSNINDIREIEKNVPRNDGYRSEIVSGNVFSSYSFVDFREQDNSVIQYFKDLPKSNEKPKVHIPKYIYVRVSKVENVDEYMYKSKANIIKINKYNCGASGETLVFFEFICNSIFSGVIYDIIKSFIGLFSSKIKSKYSFFRFNNRRAIKEMSILLNCNEEDIKLIDISRNGKLINLIVMTVSIEKYNVLIQPNGNVCNIKKLDTF